MENPATSGPGRRSRIWPGEGGGKECSSRGNSWHGGLESHGPRNKRGTERK